MRDVTGPLTVGMGGVLPPGDAAAAEQAEYLHKLQPQRAEQVNYLQAREEQEMVSALHTMMRADQLRADKAFMERFRAWLRAKRAELDQQLDRIGV